MRLNLRLKKALALATVVAITATTVPVMTYASDYDNHWAKEMITKWSEKEVLKGYEDGTFKPNEKVTRGELAAILVRVFGLLDTTSAEKYTDVEEMKWYAADIAKVSSAGIMNDYEDGTFRPDQEATREEAAYAIAKAYKIAAKDTNLTFKDQADISEWVEDEIVSLVAGGYLNGNPDGTFRPQASLTRAEAVTMVDKITADLVNVPGIYSQDIEGHLVVNTKGVELKDMTITGNLYLAEGIGEGDVKLDNVTVLGDVIVEGGSVNTVHILGQSKINNIIVDKAGKNPVRVLFGNLVEVKGIVTLKSTAHIQGNGIVLSEVIIDGAAEVQLIGKLKIEKVTIKLPTELVLVDGVEINHLIVEKDAINTIIRGRGEKSKVKNILVKANGLQLKSGFTYNKDKIVVDKSVTTKPKHPETGGGGGGGGGGGSSKPDVENKEIHLTGLTVKLGNEDRAVAMTNNTLNVDVYEDKITINGVAFESDEVITSITAHEKNNIAKLNVAVELAGKLNATLEAGKPQSANDLASLVANEDLQEGIWGTLETLSKEIGLTDLQYKRAKVLLGEALGDIQKYPALNDNKVSVAYIIGRAERLENKLQDPDVKALYEKLEKALETLGVTVKGLNTDELSISTKLVVTVPGTTAYEIDKIKVNVNYK